MRIEGLLGGAVSRIVNKTIETKIGYKPDINLSSLNLKTLSGENEAEDEIELTMRVSMKRDDFERLIEEATE